jgi:peptidoglycan/xylan/chitin deacetylase (PgdA/CDA1 family)
MSQLAKEVEAKGYGYFDWNISSGDAGGTTDPNVEYKNVINSLSKSRGNVILMHDIKKHTSQAIGKIIKYGLDNGYKFKVLTKDVVCHQRINN